MNVDNEKKKSGRWNRINKGADQSKIKKANKALRFKFKMSDKPMCTEKSNRQQLKNEKDEQKNGSGKGRSTPFIPYQIIKR